LLLPENYSQQRDDRRYIEEYWVISVMDYIISKYILDSGRPSMKHRKDLDFTEACLFESMRLGSVFGIGIPHMAICDSQIGMYLLRILIKETC
jgi:hypothetical protein